ncbi:MAG: NAD(P)/FAD-dependent oxidoreductase [Deltaproteobacteria bacterium]|nr:NAD(P)/FAD-dependent oxidoreductase [Deltaproteobacteria bacterium]
MLRGILADRFEVGKIPADLDAIVIGSGMSGLTCAAVLSRTGQRVLVVEQHYVVGGGSHMFQLRGGLKFDSGLHYLVPYSGHLIWLATGGSEMPLRFERMGEPDGTFDRIALGDDPPFAIKHDEGHLPDLFERFPDRREEIEEYLRVSEWVLKRFPLFVLSKAFPAWLRRPWHRFVLGETWQRYAGRTVQEVLEEITDDPRLAGLLAGPWMDTGAPPGRASFLLGACVARGLSIEGGAYPVGGSTQLAKTLVPVIEAAGGRVLVRANVREILVDPRSNRATGVEMQDGTVIRGKQVVSSVGYHNTFGKLVPDDITKSLKIPRHLAIGNSCGFVMVNIGLRGTAEELGLTCTNLWYHPTRADGDMFGAVNDFMTDPSNPEHDPMIMVTFPSIKDRAGAEAYPGKTTCQILCMADYRWFEQYAGRRTRRRGQEYKALKAAWGDRLLGLLLRFYPQLEGHIELVDVSTPLSIQHYLGTDEGGAVGLDHTPARFTDWEVMRHLDSRTRIEGLWLTGQDTVTCGQPIVQGAGLLTAMRMLGFWRSTRFLARTLPPIVRKLIADSRANAPGA